MKVAANTQRAGPKRKRRLLQHRSQELQLLANYQIRMPKQLNIAFWQREATRLLLGYLRTDREIHRLAFKRHIAGMLIQIPKARTKR